jgi:hypothetical protein
MYQIVKYADLVQPGHGRRIGLTYERRADAVAALLGRYPGRTEDEIMGYAQCRVEFVAGEGGDEDDGE